MNAVYIKLFMYWKYRQSRKIKWQNIDDTKVGKSFVYK
jgi:hypothetical protein